MARIRTIKPEFWDSPDTAKGSHTARLFFISLWNWADDYGKGTASAKALIGFAFPNDDDISVSDYPRLASELQSAWKVVFYEVDGRPYYYIPGFTKHQRTEKKAASRIPDPPEDVSAGQGHIDGPSDSSDGSSDTVDGRSVTGTGEQGNRGTGSLVSEVADAPSDDESDDEPPRDELREDVELVCRHLVEVMAGAGCRKPAVTNRWRDHARLMIDKDGREPDRIVRAIDWAWNDDFWRGKIESIPKLRIQYDKLRIAADKGSKSNVTPVDFGAQPKDPKDRPLYAADDVRARWTK